MNTDDNKDFEVEEEIIEYEDEPLEIEESPEEIIEYGDSDEDMPQNNRGPFGNSLNSYRNNLQSADKNNNLRNNFGKKQGINDGKVFNSKENLANRTNGLTNQSLNKTSAGTASKAKTAVKAKAGALKKQAGAAVKKGASSLITAFKAAPPHVKLIILGVVGGILLLLLILILIFTVMAGEEEESNAVWYESGLSSLTITGNIDEEEGTGEVDIESDGILIEDVPIKKDSDGNLVIEHVEGDGVMPMGLPSDPPANLTNGMTYMARLVQENYSINLIEDSPQMNFAKQLTEDKYGFARYNDDYVIALGSYYHDGSSDIGVARYRITILDEDSKETSFTAILGDAKADSDTDDSNMYQKEDGSVVEMIVYDNEDITNPNKRFPGTLTKIEKIQGNEIYLNLDIIDSEEDDEPDKIAFEGTLNNDEVYSAGDLEEGSIDSRGYLGDGASEYANILLTSGELQWPVANTTYISSYYGYRYHPVSGIYKFHNGIDIAPSWCEEYGTADKILAAEDGTVIMAKYYYGYGYCIQIDHGGGLVTLYAHCLKDSFLVEKGDDVERGQIIAKVGSTGISTGPHLHYGVYIDGEHVDPLNYYDYESIGG